MARINQRSFAGGVLSPAMMARYDDSKYQSGLSICRNFVALPQGVVENRAGFVHVAEAMNAFSRIRLLPFIFSDGDAMVIELGNKRARFHRNGKPVLNDDGSVYSVETPWESDELSDLRYVQSNDVMTIAHKSHAPQELRRYGMTDWRVRAVNFGQKFAAPELVVAQRTSSAKDDPNADKYTWAYKVSAMNADKTVEGPASEEASVVANLYQTGTVVTVSWQPVAGAKWYRVYKKQAGVFGYIGDTDQTSITDENYAPELGTTPRLFDDSEPSGIGRIDITAAGSGYLPQTASLVYTDFVADRSGSFAAANLLDSNGRPYFTATASSQYSRPKEPEINPAEYCRLYDASGLGSGGELEFVTEKRVRRWTDSYWESTGDSDQQYIYDNVEVTLIVKDYRIKAPGAGYMRPRARFSVLKNGETYESYKKNHPIVTTKKWAELQESWVEFDLGTTGTAGAHIEIADPEGQGAKAEAVVSDEGAITEIRVTNAGSGYVSPTVTITGAGTGAEAVAIVSEMAGTTNPVAVCYFEQRRCFAGYSSDPLMLKMTRPGSEDDMSFSLPSVDDDRIKVRFTANQTNPIRHLIALQNLIALTSAGEWRISTVDTDALTPSSVTVRQMSSVGSSNVTPAVVDNLVVYSAARGGHVRELGFSGDRGYLSADLSLRATHLFDGKTIRDIAYAKAPQPIVWCVSSNGRLLGLTYIPGQQIAAWHEHVTDGEIESCCVVPEGDEDVLYIAVVRYINGQERRYIERMSERSRGIFLDAAYASSGEMRSEITGLTWLEGKEVGVLADGAVLDRRIVVNGRIELDAPASRVVVGLPYDSDIQTLPVVAISETSGPSHGARKRIRQVWLRLYESSGVSAGPDFDDLVELKQRTNEMMGSPPRAFSGEYGLRPSGGWTQDGQLCVRQSDPLPLSISAISMDIEIGG